MNAFRSSMVCVAIAAAFVTLGERPAAAQYVVASPVTTPVVAYQPVVVPTSPALVSGWYPGKLLDTWAANRLAYRSSAVATPVTAAVPVTSYRPVTGVTYQTTYMPVQVYRPLISSPVIATTAYSPVVTATAACCEPYSAATVTSYAPSSPACCGTTTSDGAYVGEATSQPYIPPSEPEPARARYPAEEQPGAGSGNSGEAQEPDNTKSRVQSEGGGEEQQQEPDGASGANWEPPPLRGPGIQLPSADQEARQDKSGVTQAVYKEPVQPRLATTGGRAGSPRKPDAKSIPSRAEREAMWTPVTD